MINIISTQRLLLEEGQGATVGFFTDSGQSIIMKAEVVEGKLIVQGKEAATGQEIQL